MTSKSIKLETNYNNKLDCPHFLHIDLAPSGPITESLASNTIIEISTKDNSHSPVFTQIEDLCRIELKDIPSALTWASHGMSSQEFIQFIKKYIPGILPTTKMAVYFYKHTQVVKT